MDAGQTGEYLDLLQRYGKFFADIYLHPVIFFILVAIIICVYIVRYIAFVHSYQKIATEKGVLKEYKIYIAAHMSIQLLICFLISYFVIKFANALIDSYIINWILAPTVGLIVSIVVDYKVITPLENKSGFFKNPIIDKKDDEKTDKSSESSKSINNITINVGSKETTTTKEKEVKVEPMKTETEIEIKESNDDIIRSLIHMQEEQSRQLKNLCDVVDAIKDDIVTNRRFELYDAMMTCILRGSATPDEFDRISEKMKTYTALKGNHIQDIYEKKFMNLPIK